RLVLPHRQARRHRAVAPQARRLRARPGRRRGSEAAYRPRDSRERAGGTLEGHLRALQARAHPPGDRAHHPARDRVADGRRGRQGSPVRGQRAREGAGHPRRRRRAPRARLTTMRGLGLAAVLLWIDATGVAAQEQVTALAPVKLSTTTGEKPQSKLWFHAGRWWAVLPSTSATPTGTWLWRLGADNHWTNVLRLSSSTK